MKILLFTDVRRSDADEVIGAWIKAEAKYGDHVTVRAAHLHKTGQYEAADRVVVLGAFPDIVKDFGKMAADGKDVRFEGEVEVFDVPEAPERKAPPGRKRPKPSRLRREGLRKQAAAAAEADAEDESVPDPEKTAVDAAAVNEMDEDALKAFLLSNDVDPTTVEGSGEGGAQLKSDLVAEALRFAGA